MLRRSIRFVAATLLRKCLHFAPLLSIVVLSAVATPCSAEIRGNAFDLIGSAPGEANLVIALRHGADHRAQLAQLPVAEPAQRFLRNFGTYNAYIDFLQTGAATAGESFDRLFGRELLFVALWEDVGSDWALYAQADQRAVLDMIAALKGKLRHRRGGVALYTIDDGRFLVGLRDDRWLLGPAKARTMFDRCLPLLSGTEPSRPMRETACYREARFIGRGDAAYLSIDAQRSDSFTAGVIRQGNRRVEVDIAIHSAVLREQVGDVPAIDTSILKQFETKAALAIVESLPDRSTRAFRFVQRLVPAIDIDPEVHSLLGPRMVLLITPGGGRDLRLYWCLEVRSCAGVERSFDTMMAKVTAAHELPAIASLRPIAPSLRVADMTRLVESRLPLLRPLLGEAPITLGWQVVPSSRVGGETDVPGWWVVGVPASGVPAVGEALVAGGSGSGARVAAAVSRGSLHGPHAAQVVERLPLPLLPSMAEVLAGVDRVQWCLKRTSDRSVEAAIRLELRGDASRNAVQTQVIAP